RNLTYQQSSPERIEQALCAFRDAPPRQGVVSRALAAGCAGAAFCVLNGGDPISWVCSFIVGTVILGIRGPLAARRFNGHLTIFTIAATGSLLAAVLGLLTHTTTAPIALVAPLLFLVPGVPMINGGIDIVRNHVTIGI